MATFTPHAQKLLEEMEQATAALQRAVALAKKRLENDQNPSKSTHPSSASTTKPSPTV